VENNRLTKELKAANTSLMQKNAETSGLLEQIVNHSTDGIVVVDTNNKVIFSNPCALSLLIEHYRVLPGDEFKLPFKEDHIVHQTLTRSAKNDLIIEVRSSMISHEGGQAFLITLHDLSDAERLHHEKQRSETRIKKSLLQMARAISITVEKNAPYMTGHQNRVATLAVAIANKMDLADNIIEGINIAGLVHDTGMNYVPTEILNRPAPLTNEERLMVQEHPTIGYEIMSTVDFVWPIAEIVLQHHERIDGSGYPNAITGDHMKLESKILAVADVVSAMCEPRAYRQAYPVNEILAYIKQESGKKFEPVVVTHCISVLTEGYFNLI
jgi:HD-GYP domain-containing protein (c-di-GMP phosphodiesterase class II)